MPLALAPQGRPFEFRSEIHLPLKAAYFDFDYNEAMVRKAAQRKKNAASKRNGLAIVLEIISQELDGHYVRTRTYSLVFTRTYDPFVRYGKSLYPYTSPNNAYNTFTWTILWDIENVSIPKYVNGADATKSLVNAVRSLRGNMYHDSVRRITAFTNLNRLTKAYKNELQTNGVHLYHCETAKRKDAADKALISELLLEARDLDPRNSGIVLISGDQDFAYPLASLRSNGFTTAVIAPQRISCSPLLVNIPHYVLSFRMDVLKEFMIAPTPSSSTVTNSSQTDIEDDSLFASPAMARKLAAQNGNGNKNNKNNNNSNGQNTQQNNTNNNGTTVATAAKKKWNVAKWTKTVARTGAGSFCVAAAIFLANSAIEVSGVSRDNSIIVGTVGALILIVQCALTWYFIQAEKKTQQMKNGNTNNNNTNNTTNNNNTNTKNGGNKKNNRQNQAPNGSNSNGSSSSNSNIGNGNGNRSSTSRSNSVTSNSNGKRYRNHNRNSPRRRRALCTTLTIPAHL